MIELSPREIRYKLKNAIKLNLSAQEISELAEMMRKHKSSTDTYVKEVNAMMRKPGRDRYIYTVKRIADQEFAWTLKNDQGIIITEDGKGNHYFYIWPHKEYALKCMAGEWKNCELLELTLESLLCEVLPNLVQKGTRIVALEIPNDPQVTSAPANDFLNNLLHERSQFE